jgi:hypothetical protein
VAVIYKDEFSVEGTTVTHIPSGAWWTFNFNSPNPYRSDTRRLGKSLTIADAAKDIWALHFENDAVRYTSLKQLQRSGDAVRHCGT